MFEFLVVVVMIFTLCVAGAILTQLARFMVYAIFQLCLGLILVIGIILWCHAIWG